MGSVKVGDKVWIKTLKQMEEDTHRIDDIDTIWLKPTLHNDGNSRYQQALGTEVVIIYVNPVTTHYEDYEKYRAKYHEHDGNDFLLAECDIITTPQVSLGDIYGTI